jgi:hypothetical protein
MLALVSTEQEEERSERVRETNAGRDLVEMPRYVYMHEVHTNVLLTYHNRFVVDPIRT